MNRRNLLPGERLAAFQKHLILADRKLLNRLLARKDLRARRQQGFWWMLERAGKKGERK